MIWSFRQKAETKLFVATLKTILKDFLKRGFWKLVFTKLEKSVCQPFLDPKQLQNDSKIDPEWSPNLHKLLLGALQGPSKSPFVALQPLASGLYVASAECAKRKQSQLFCLLVKKKTQL